MSEPIWCYVDIVVPDTWIKEGEALPPWAELLQDVLINGESWSTERDAGSVFISANGEGNYGLYDNGLEEVLDWCEKHRVPYIARDETKYDCAGEQRLFDGEKLIVAASDEARGVVLDHATWLSIDAGTHEDYTSVADYFAKHHRSIAELSIDHLSTEPPEEEEE